MNTSPALPANVHVINMPNKKGDHVIQASIMLIGVLLAFWLGGIAADRQYKQEAIDELSALHGDMVCELSSNKSVLQYAIYILEIDVRLSSTMLSLAPMVPVSVDSLSRYLSVVGNPKTKNIPGHSYDSFLIGLQKHLRFINAWQALRETLRVGVVISGKPDTTSYFREYEKMYIATARSALQIISRVVIEQNKKAAIMEQVGSRDRLKCLLAEEYESGSFVPRDLESAKKLWLFSTTSG